MQTLLVKKHGNSQAAVLDEKLLNRIGELRHAARVLTFSRIAGAAHLAKSVSFLEGRLGFLKGEIAVGIHQRLGLPHPNAEHLRGFLFQRHSG